MQESKKSPELKSVPTAGSGIQALNHKVVRFYNDYHQYQDAVFFIFGFLFDLMLIGRIDEGFDLIQQAVYIILIALVASADWYDTFQPFNWRPRMQKVWSYRTPVIHFLMGTLLNFYTIFYFKSASLLTSFGFLGFLIILLLANEIPFIKKQGPLVRFSLFSLCLISYLTYLIPILLGYIGVIPFFIAQTIGLAFVLLIYNFLKNKLGDHIGVELSPTTMKYRWLYHPAFKSIILPFLIVQLGFIFCYLLKILPPVPLSAKYLGVYHQVTKENDKYKLGYTRSGWYFWQNGDQTFRAKPEDKIYIFTQLFSPTNFRDKITVRFEFLNQKGNWEFRDNIPMSIVGGRDDGFRGVVFKSNYQPGRWRVRLLTNDEREVRRIYFRVVSVESSDIAEMQFDYR